jgi:hypothetical protein
MSFFYCIRIRSSRECKANEIENEAKIDFEENKCAEISCLADSILLVFISLAVVARLYFDFKSLNLSSVNLFH